MKSFFDIVECGEMSDIYIASNLVINQSKSEAIEKVLTIEDTLMKILKYLDADSIKTAALVCKKWNEVISSSPVIMKRFQLRAQRILSSEISTRKHWDVDFRDCRYTNRRVFDFCCETS